MVEQKEVEGCEMCEREEGRSEGVRFEGCEGKGAVVSNT